MNLHTLGWTLLGLNFLWLDYRIWRWMFGRQGRLFHKKQPWKDND